MSKLWEDMTTDEKFEWLQHQDQSTQQMVAGISAVLMKSGVSSLR